MWTDFLNGPTIVVIPTLTVVACMYLLWRQNKHITDLRLDIEEISSKLKRLEMLYQMVEQTLKETRSHYQDILENQAEVRTELRNLKEYWIRNDK